MLFHLKNLNIYQTDSFITISDESDLNIWGRGELKFTQESGYFFDSPPPVPPIKKPLMCLGSSNNIYYP